MNQQATNRLSQYGKFSILRPQHLVFFKQLVNVLFSQNNLNKQPSKIIIHLNTSLQLISSPDTEPTAAYICKKICLLQSFIINMARKQLHHQEIFQAIQVSLEQLVQKEMPILVEEPKKRQSSISKIYGYIRGMTSSRDKRQTKKENSNGVGLEDKRALKELVNKVFKPLGFYLLKIVKSWKVYCRLVVGQHGEDERPLYWKMANWSNLLGQALKQLIRLGHYFNQDFLGIQLLLIYIISIDLTMYYDMLQNEIERRGNLLITNQQNPLLGTNLSDSTQESTPPSNSEETRECLEVKELIEEAGLIKEHLNIVYCSPKMKQWKKLFARSQHYKYEQIKGNSQNTERIMAFIQHRQKELNKMLKKQESRRQQSSFSLANKPSTPHNKVTQLKAHLPENVVVAARPETPKASIARSLREQRGYLLQMLESRKRQMQIAENSHPQTVEAVFPVGKDAEEQSSMAQLNILARNNKVNNQRRMRLMHLNNDKDFKTTKDNQFARKR